MSQPPCMHISRLIFEPHLRRFLAPVAALHIPPGPRAAPHALRRSSPLAPASRRNRPAIARAPAPEPSAPPPSRRPVEFAFALLAARSRSCARRSSSRRATDSRDEARENSSASLRLSCSRASALFSCACCSRTQPVQVFGQNMRFPFQILQPLPSLVHLPFFRGSLPGSHSRSSRFSASGPLPFFLPPLTAWP